MSSLSWIVLDDRERELAQELVDAFREKGTVDELGLRAVLMAVGDQLFPGVTTLHTRLRYTLFVPWIYSKVGLSEGPPERLRDEAYDQEIALIGALQAGQEPKGIIGVRVRSKNGPLPSRIYWNALQTWGIRQDSGGHEDYFAALATPDSKRDASVFWHPDLPESPKDFLTEAKFRLTRHEADFLVDRLVDSHPDSALTYLAKAHRTAECEFIWEHPHLEELPETTRLLVDHARIFSGLMHSAAFLYNLMLSELRENEDWIERHTGQLEHWRGEVNLCELKDWRFEDLCRTLPKGVHILPPTFSFVEGWREAVLDTGGDVAASKRARCLVRARVNRLKRSRSPFVNRTALDRFSGSVGTSRLRFRWPEAKSHLRDIADAD